MGKKRDHVKEIISIRDRSSFHGKFDLLKRLLAIDSVIENIDETKTGSKEILKYIPIATVASFESFFRSIVAELIDSGEPYYQNLLKFNESKNIRFDFNIINAIQKKKISIGDFVSHLLSCNNLRDFNSNLSILTQTDFIEELKSFELESSVKFSVDISNTFKSNYPTIINSVDKVFELRHIFCHEFATNIELEYLLVKKIYEDCKVFLLHTLDYIGSLLSPDASSNLLEMKIKSQKKFERVNNELNNIIDEINKSNFESIGFYFEREDLSLVIDKWKDYREAKSELLSKSFKGGSMYPLFKLHFLINITNKFIDELIEEFKLKNITS